MKAKILVVDDIDAVRELAKKVLEKQGYQVTTAADGKTAIELFNQDPNIALILLDIMLPDTTGFDVMREIDAIRKNTGRDVKVCFLSGRNTREDIREAIRAGGDDYIVKPILIDTLAAKVASLLGHSRPTEYAQLSVLFRGTLKNKDILPDIYIVELSEDQLKLRSTAGFKAELVFEFKCPDLEELTDSIGEFTARVKDCQKQRHGVYFLSAEFVGLAEDSAMKIRSAAIRASKEAPESE